jgi:hypothetical protein
VTGAGHDLQNLNRPSETGNLLRFCMTVVQKLNKPPSASFKVR